MADWYYIGHYGQLGPLTRDQIDDLVMGGVISRETYVWYTGMSDWVPAERCHELTTCFASSAPAAPPPAPTVRFDPPLNPQPQSYGVSSSPHLPNHMYGGYQRSLSTVRSDRSRALGGVLNLIIPGVGRMYLGYAAIGVLQLVLFFCGGVGFIWSFIDGIIILTGGVKMDGYGRELPE